jgi:polynucleotide 5'-hydroxyl-kinase GRC3/NOL9
VQTDLSKMIPTMRYVLPKNNTLLIRGPASLQLLSGNATVLGAPLGQERRVTVRHEKQLPVQASTEAHLEVLRGKSGDLFEIQGSTIPDSWRVAADTLLGMEKGKVMVIGAADVGKSTLCTYLLNSLLGRISSLKLVDADIGQADLGPPTTIGAACPTVPVLSLVDLKPEHTIFIGHTSPSPVERKLREGVSRLARAASDSLTIINTDGWILDPLAILHKIGLIGAINPDLVIALARGNELQPILVGSRSTSLNVDIARDALARSRGDRRKIRTANYRRFLERAKTWTISSRDVEISSNLPIFRGQGKLEFENSAVGLLDDEGYMLQLGILMNIDNESFRVYSRFAEGVRKIDIGQIRLLTDGSEIGYFES